MRTITGGFLLCSLLIILFVGCTSVIVTPSEVDAPYPTGTPTDVFTITPTAIQPTSTATGQPLIFYFPEVEKRCPENREVSFDRLGVNTGTTVILTDLAKTGLWKYSTDNQDPILVKTMLSNTWYSLTLNPTGENSAFIVRNDDNSFSVWLLSMNSGDQREIFNIDYFEGAYPNIHWVSNNELLVSGNCTGAGCPFPIKVLNIATEVEVDVEDTYSDPSDNYLGFIANNGKYTALYSSYNDDGYNQFYAYDYSDRQRISILPWLKDRIFFYPLIGTNLGLFDAGNSMVMIVEQSYGFDVGVVDTSVENLTQKLLYDLVMKRVFTDISFDGLEYYLVDSNPVNKYLMLSVNYTDYANTVLDDNLTSTPKHVENALLAIDSQNPVVNDRINNLIFVDYCFSTLNYFDNGFSPDGRIEVFSSDDEIVFLDVETGNISRLSGWSFVGWAK